MIDKGIKYTMDGSGSLKLIECVSNRKDVVGELR